ncbi:MAG: hypothetical protein ABEJ57_08035 [Halobacteriaceae archaeon]
MSVASIIPDWMTGPDLDWRAIRPWVALFLGLVYAVMAYFWLTDATPTGEVRYLLYPVVWITVGAWAIAATDPSPGNRRHMGIAGAVATLYFLAVLWVPGNIGLADASVVTWRVEMYSPGWGPLVAVVSPWVRLFLVPFEVVGYAALAYLVYANLLTLARGTIGGALGLVTCVGCTVPVLAPLVGVLGGPATSLTTTAYAYSYDLGTLFFVATVGVLYHSHRRTRD